MRMAVAVDVPDLEAGIAFYHAVFGFEETGRPLPVLAALAAGDQRLLLVEKAPGTRPFPNAPQARDYAPHWTPVHLDFHLSDIEATRDRALAAGALMEQWWEVPGRPRAGFFRDPFGHGFCLIEERESRP